MYFCKKYGQSGVLVLSAGVVFVVLCCAYKYAVVPSIFVVSHVENGYVHVFVIAFNKRGKAIVVFANVYQLPPALLASGS